MGVPLSEIEEEALQLSVSERALLAQHLIESLDASDTAENERLWVEEAERRFQAYREGRIASRPASDVFRAALGGAT